VDIINVRPLWSLAVSVTDDFGVTRTVSASWLEFGPLTFNGCTAGTQCASCGTSPCQDTSITYSGGNPTDSVTVSVVKVCDVNQKCATDAAGMAALLPPGWSATAKGTTLTVTMDCTNQPACPNGIFYADVYIVLVDHGTCVAPAYVQTFSTIFNVDV